MTKGQMLTMLGKIKQHLEDLQDGVLLQARCGKIEPKAGFELLQNIVNMLRGECLLDLLINDLKNPE